MIDNIDRWLKVDCPDWSELVVSPPSLSLSTRCAFAYNLTGDTLQRADASRKERPLPLSTISSRRTFAREHQSAKDLLLLFEPESRKLRIIQLRTRPRAHARTKSFFLSGNSLVPNVTTTEPGRSPSQEESIRAMNDRWKSLRFRDGIRIRRRLFSWKDLSGRGDGGDRYIARGRELFDRVWKIDGERRRGGD